MVLIILSCLSGYQLKPEGYVVNFPILTRLTPVGLVANLGFDAHPELNPFYFKVVARDTSLWMLGLVAIVVVLSLYILRREE